MTKAGDWPITGKVIAYTLERTTPFTLAAIVHAVYGRDLAEIRNDKVRRALCGAATTAIKRARAILTAEHGNAGWLKYDFSTGLWLPRADLPECKRSAPKKRRARPRPRSSVAELPPRARETWLAVTEYRARHPGVSIKTACDKLGMNSATFGNAQRALRSRRGVASEAEAFSCEDDW